MNNDKDAMCHDQTECRKFSHGHPKPNPGIFTVFCPCGICYGSQVMTKHESPEVPFDIFKSQFSKRPKDDLTDQVCSFFFFFVSLCTSYRKANYFMNNDKDVICCDQTECRKFPHGHLTLSPAF